MSFWAPNIDSFGRLVRALLGLALIGGSAASFAWNLPILGWILAAGGLFCLFEAVRGWCVARACRIKTPL
jgi:hypothetical protein